MIQEVSSKVYPILQ